MSNWIQYKGQSGYNANGNMDIMQIVVRIQYKGQSGYNTRGNLYAIHMVIHYNTNGSWGITQKWQYGYNINFSSWIQHKCKSGHYAQYKWQSRYNTKSTLDANCNLGTKLMVIWIQCKQQCAYVETV